VELAKRRYADYVLFYFDLDGLKSVNDELGHASGDEALRDMAEAMRNSFRHTDVIARLGGDEFTVFAVDMKPDESLFTLSRLAAAVSEQNDSGRKPYRLSYSVGTAVWNPDLHANLDQLMTEADGKLYEEKRRKKAGGPTNRATDDGIKNPADAGKPFTDTGRKSGKRGKA
jgi:two-component system, cell cycle response regulator